MDQKIYIKAFLEIIKLKKILLNDSNIIYEEVFSNIKFYL